VESDLNMFRFLICISIFLFPHFSFSANDLAATYPKRPIRIIVPVAPGGGLDMISRSAGQMMSDRWGQSVVVDNRSGGGTVVATEIVARAVPDGYTLLAATDTLNILGAMKRVPFDVRKAFAPVVVMTMQPYLLLISAGLPVNSVKELIAYSMTQAIRFGSSGVGTTGHIGMENLASLTGAKFVHVPYKGGAPSLAGILGGEIHMLPGVMLSAAPLIKSGKLRALATMGLKRIPAMSDLPTVSELGWPGFKIVNSYNLFDTAGVSKPILFAINSVVSDGMNLPKMAQRLAAEGIQVDERMNPDEFKAYILKEYVDVERQVKNLDIKLY